MQLQYFHPIIDCARKYIHLGNAAMTFAFGGGLATLVTLLFASASDLLFFSGG